MTEYLTSEIHIQVWAFLALWGVFAAIVSVVVAYAAYRGWQATNEAGERLLALRRR